VLSQKGICIEKGMSRALAAVKNEAVLTFWDSLFVLYSYSLARS